MIDTSEIELEFSGYTQEEVRDIEECLRILYSTKAGTMPLDREFGIDMSCLEKEIGPAKSEFVIEVIAKTDTYEPRVKVSEVTFETDIKTGILCPRIRLEKGDEGNEF